MTMRVIRWLQQGSLTAIVPLVLLGVVALVLLAPATERPATMQDTVRSGKVHRTSPDSYPAAAGQTLYIPTGAHSTGALGTNWRTDVAVHNPGSTQASYTFALLKRDTDNSSPTTASFSLAPGTTTRYPDIIDSVFGFYGAAALRVTVTSGSVLFTSNTYNRLSSDNTNNFPDGSTFGNFVPAFLDTTAITYADEGRLIHLSHTNKETKTNYRTAIGLLNVTASTLPLTIDLYAANGALLGTVSPSLQPYEFKQYEAIFSPYISAPLADGYAVIRTTAAGGRFFAYASIVDNRTGDPMYVPAQTLPRSSTSPTPTPTTPPATPTPTQPPSGNVNLIVYKPTDWPNCVVCDYRATWAPPDAPYNSAAYGTTYVNFTLANVGTSTLQGPVKFAIKVDGVTVMTPTWSNSTGLEASRYVVFNPLTVTISTAGQHTVTVVADPDNLIPETNESDNSCSFTDTWSSIFLAPEPAAKATGSRTAHTVTAAGTFSLDGRPVKPSAAAEPASAGQVLYIPTGAHSTGALGTNWRTDVAVHNPGSTQASYTFALLKRDTDNSSPTTASFSLAPGTTTRYPDIIDSVFGFYGAAALRVTVTSGSVLFTSNTYNRLSSDNTNNFPDGSTFGNFVPAFLDTTAITYADEGRLIHLSHTNKETKTNYRTAIGLLNVTASTLPLTIDLYAANGALLGTVSPSLQPYEFKQYEAIFSPYISAPLADGYAVIRTTAAGGRFFAYASIVDNRTGDPMYVPAQTLPRSSTTPTPTPTPTPPTGGGTITSGDTATGIFGGLTKIGTGNTPSLPSMVSTALTTGIPALIDIAVGSHPATVTKTSNGMKLNYGTGYTSPKGTFTGAIDITYSNVTTSGNTISGSYTVTPKSFTKNGQALPFSLITGTANATLTSANQAKGTATVEATDAANPSLLGAKGTVTFDTSRCSKYPISGSIYVKELGKLITYSFTPTCDNTYQRTEGTIPTATPWPAGTCPVSFFHIDTCSGDQIFLDDWKVTTTAGGAVSLALVQHFSNVSLSGGGTWRTNPNYFSWNDRPRIWNVPFTYTYTDYSGSGSFTLTGSFTESGIENATLTMSGCNKQISEIIGTWHCGQ
jgi:hypothetical protein